MSDQTLPMSSTRRYLVLALAFLGWMFAGQTMSLHLLFVRPVTNYFIRTGAISTPVEVASNPAEEKKWRESQSGKWMSWYTTAFLVGAAAGGALFGWMGDRWGRARAMSLSILCYSLFSGVSYFARSPEELLAERFAACLGVGGMWPNGVALVSEVWSKVSRPFLAGVIGTAANVGFVFFALIALWLSITPDSWRWVFLVGMAPVVLGIVSLAIVPESPSWLAVRDQPRTKNVSTAELFGPGLRYAMIIGMLLGAIPIVGNWGGNNWIIPWSDEVAGAADPAKKAWMQITRSSGAAIGSLCGGFLANLFGRRLTYFLISAVCLVVSGAIYRFLTPLDPWFPAWVFLLGVVGVAYFGWLPLYLPELFPTRVRSTGTGVAFNFGRILAVPCVLGAGYVHGFFDGDYAKVGQFTSLIYLLGMVVACLAPDTSKRDMSQ